MSEPLTNVRDRSPNTKSLTYGYMGNRRNTSTINNRTHRKAPAHHLGSPNAPTRSRHLVASLSPNCTRLIGLHLVVVRAAAATATSSEIIFLVVLVGRFIFASRIFVLLWLLPVILCIIREWCIAASILAVVVVVCVHS
ncbi:hypothetical protein GGR57DRAFT_55102 [Xylariaceae sp. FL1272]|nr:hypothetical protein GGR57DRAFT_55102 [Xylariaceae sp. FL1272]